VIDSAIAKKEVADKFKQPFETAESKAKSADEAKGIKPPAGPSQSPMDLQPPQPASAPVPTPDQHQLQPYSAA